MTGPFRDRVGGRLSCGSNCEHLSFSLSVHSLLACRLRHISLSFFHAYISSCLVYKQFFSGRTEYGGGWFPSSSTSPFKPLNSPLGKCKLGSQIGTQEGRQGKSLIQMSAFFPKPAYHIFPTYISYSLAVLRVGVLRKIYQV